MKTFGFQVVESGAMGSEIYIVSKTDRPITDTQLDEAWLALDTALSLPACKEWLQEVCPWAGNHRFVSGIRSNTRTLIATLNK